MKLSGTGAVHWSRTVGGAGNDIPLMIIPTNDRGYAIAGETDFYGAGNFDAYIVKLDSSGTLKWIRTIGGTGEEYGESIVQTSDGGYAVGGYTFSFGAGDYDMYIAKLDAGGILQWTKTIGTPGYDYALSIIQTNDRGYALFGSTAYSGAGHNDFCVVKLDSNGSLQWTRTIGGTGGDYGFCIIQTTYGGFALSGTTISFGAGNYDMYIVKLDAGGMLQWTRTVGGGDFDYGYSIIQTSDGGFALSGSTASFGAGGYDAYFVKLDSNGSLQWTRTAGGVNDENVLSIKQTSDGGYVGAGSTSSFGSGNADFFIVKLDSSGNTCGNSSSPSPAAGSGGTLGNPAFTTTSPTPTVTSPISSTGTGGEVTAICLIGIQPISNEIPMYYELHQNFPNPFNPVTKIKFDVPNFAWAQYTEPVQLLIYDILGRKVISLVSELLKPGTYEVDWDASRYPSGVYFCKLTSGNFSETKKMVLAK